MNNIATLQENPRRCALAVEREIFSEVDSEGLNVEYLSRYDRSFKLIYTTPYFCI
jgi:hypothetical protein